MAPHGNATALCAFTCTRPTQDEDHAGTKEHLLWKSRFLELHRFADKDDSCPKKIGVSIWGLWKKRRKRSLVARILLFWHCYLCCRWDSVEHDPKGHGLTSVCEPRPGEHQSGKFRKTLHSTQRTLSHSCIHGAACTSLQTASACCSASILWKRKRGLFSGFSEKNKSQDKLFFREGKEIVEIENRSQLTDAKQKAWPQVW